MGERTDINQEIPSLGQALWRLFLDAVTGGEPTPGIEGPTISPPPPESTPEPKKDTSVLGGSSLAEYLEKSKRSIADPLGWAKQQAGQILPERISFGPFGEATRRETPGFGFEQTGTPASTTPSIGPTQEDIDRVNKEYEDYLAAQGGTPGTTAPTTPTTPTGGPGPFGLPEDIVYLQVPKGREKEFADRVEAMKEQGKREGWYKGWNDTAGDARVIRQVAQQMGLTPGEPPVPKPGEPTSPAAAVAGTPSTPTAPATSAAPGAPTDFGQKMEAEVKAQQVPPYKETPKYEPTAEWMKAAESLPRTVEALTGRPRPQQPVRGFGPSFMLGAVRAAGGIDPYKEEIRAQEIRDQQYREDALVATTRQNAIYAAQLKGIEYKINENEKQRQKEEMDYAKLGEMNPMLAQNPAYKANLFRGFDQDTRDKLLAMSIDPLTGNFKEGAPLYYSPAKATEVKIWSFANLAQKMGLAKTADEAMKIGAEMMMDPAKYIEYTRNGEARLKNEVAKLAEQGRDLNTDPELKGKLEVLRILAGHKENLTKMEEFQAGKKMIEAQHQAARNRVIAAAGGNEKDERIKQALKEIDDNYSRLMSVHEYNTFGGPVGAAGVIGKAQQDKSKQAHNAQTAVAMRFFQSADPNWTTPAEASKNMELFNMMVGIANDRSGNDLDVVMSQSVPDRKMRIDKTLSDIYDLTVKPARSFISSQGYEGALQEAARKFTPPGKPPAVGYIPLRNIFEAFWFVERNPSPQGSRPDVTRNDRVRQLLLLGAPQ